MKQRIIALLLALALTLSLCAVSALAEEQDQSQAGPETEETTGEHTGEETAEGEEAPEAEEEEAPSLAGPDPEVTDLTEAVEIIPDEVGTLSFANVERRMRENNLQLLILEESVLTLEEIDYDKTYEDLRKQLNELAQTQWMLVLMGQSESDAYKQLDKAYDAVREQFDAIKDGEMQQDNADTIRQLNNLEDQIVMAGEALYVAVAALDIQEDSLERQLAALDRTCEEMDLRYELGQISALQLSEVKSGRVSLASGLETLRMNIQNYKFQLEMLIGAEQTGAIQLGELPEVTDKQLEAMDLEKDLEAAKEKSYELYDAAQTLEDARDDYKEAGDNYGYNESKYEFKAAKHTWNAAQYTYNDTVQNYELKFRTLYSQVKDYKQILDAAKVALACEQSSYEAAELKYQQGNISKNALLDAEDELRTAEEKVRSSANDLFSSYNTYCWAVQHGILN